MDDFNIPGLSEFWMNDEFKKYVAEWQLENIEKLLDAKVERCHVYNSDNRDEVYNQITITYKSEVTE